MLLLGVSVCAVCDQRFEAGHDAVVFPHFCTGNPLVDWLSHANAHYDCVRCHPRRELLEDALLGALGPTGLGPNGLVVGDIDASTRAALRVEFDSIRVVSGLILLDLEVRLQALTAFLAANQSVCDPYALREVPCLGIRLARPSETVLHIAVTRAEVYPSRALPDEVERVTRRVTEDEFAQWYRGLSAAAQWASALAPG